MTDKEILTAIKEKISSIVPDAKIMSFGSRARGDWYKESDWDTLALTEKEVTRELRDKVFDAVYPITLEIFNPIQTVVANIKDGEEHPALYSLWLSTKNDLVAI